MQDNVISLLDYLQANMPADDGVTAVYHCPETCESLDFDNEIPPQTFAEWQELGI